MIRRAWKPVAGSLVIGAPAYVFYKSYYSPPTFEILIKAPRADGKSEMRTQRVSLLPMKDIDARIQQNAISESHTRPDGFRWNYTTAYLASNDPIEDTFSNEVVERQSLDPSALGDYLFFSVMDGHGGYDTSTLLSRILIKGVALELAALFKDSSTPLQSGLLRKIKSLLSYPTPGSTTMPLFNNHNRVSQAIREAFTKLDTELLQMPLRVLANNMGTDNFQKKTIPDLSKHPLALTSMLPAISGSCALMAMFDTANKDIYVACTGDSKAVAGVWEPSSDGKGSWRIEILSEEQTGRNPSELARVRSEHPDDEKDYVVREGRILGGLEPSRAFGDARYKWPRIVQEALNEAFMVGNGRPLRTPPALLKTPPYVTATPVVTHRKMSLFSPFGSELTPNTVRFLVLATDGLWDELSNEEVVSLVAGHLSGLKGTIRKPDLRNLFPTSSGSSSVAGKNRRNEDKEGSWEFKDDNLSTHLIRNAFGGGDKLMLRKRLSIPAPLSRKFRDDVTVTVICWKDGSEQTANSNTPESIL